MLARCVQHETDHLDGDPVHRPARPGDQEGRAGGDPEAEWANAAAARRQGQPAPAVRASALTPPHEAGLRRHARAGAAVAARRCSPAGTRSSPSSPGPTRRPAAAARCRPSPVARAAPRSAGSRSSTPAHPRDEDFQARLRELAPDCCPVVAYGALVPPRRARHPGARLGQPALLAAAGLARRRAGAARGPGRRRGHRRDARSCSRRASTPARSSASSPRRSGPRDTSGDLLARLADAGAGLLVATLDAIEDGTRPRPARSRPTASRSPPRSPSTTPASTGPRRRCASTGWSAAAPRRRAPGRRSAASGSSSARSTLDRRSGSRPASCATAWSAPRRPPCGSARSAPRARARWPPPTGCAGCARTGRGFA